MSSPAAHADAQIQHAHGQHAHGQDAHDAHNEGGHGSFKSYMTGFVLSVILTVIPFWLVMGNVLDNSLVTTLVVLALGGVQMVVHVVYFLHMNTKSEGGWTFMALIFTVTLVVIMLSGTVWVMHHLNKNMMPMSAGDVLHKMP
ncbi:cytochrome o ubiquinol oxidase subunit IV [Methylobacterium sp. NEAU 140]|uniref:cytochrome o ubiquinol oxidase subunit IV n=1 Tax=Methylobacterium sp. NEAU 140 TaxID=3064945 RepID=UPI002732CEC2|nr:cytochrome o ubiquinol oxidase subunit IV [Methylobacterium sp. NEAU 140]MDP4024028.1 cytochrome o ubiquinol oxidase subunit IV [Methylobacterium sp. NEAU 140]